jgi:hypothetical protein
MTIYYTAKDIEEMAAKGIRQIEVGPGITLTDFARETAQQLNVALIDRSTTAAAPPARPAPARPASAPQPASQGRSTRASGKYNKPSGCLHGPNHIPAAPSQAAAPSIPSADGAKSNTVNRLIDLMGKVINRGE